MGFMKKTWAFAGTRLLRFAIFEKVGEIKMIAK